MQPTWHLRCSIAYVPDPLLFLSCSMHMTEVLWKMPRVGREAHQWKLKLKGYQYIIHSEHEPENSRLLLPLPPHYLNFTLPSGTEHRNSSPRTPLPFFSKTITMCLYTLSQMGPLSPTDRPSPPTCIRAISPWLPPSSTICSSWRKAQKVHSDCAHVAQLHLSKFPAWQLGFDFHLASTSHPEKPLCPVLEE